MSTEPNSCSLLTEVNYGKIAHSKQRTWCPKSFRDAFDELTKDTGGTITGGPGSITINSPEMVASEKPSHGLSPFRDHFPQEDTGVGDPGYRPAPLDCPYIWNAHAPAARQEGVSDALVDALRDRKPLPDMAPDESAIVNFCAEFYKNHRVSSSTFQIALEQFGAQHLVEISALMSKLCPNGLFPERLRS